MCYSPSLAHPCFHLTQLSAVPETEKHIAARSSFWEAKSCLDRFAFDFLASIGEVHVPLPVRNEETLDLVVLDLNWAFSQVFPLFFSHTDNALRTLVRRQDG